MRQKLPYAQVTGVDTEDEIESALHSVPPPIFLTDTQLGALGLPTNSPIGCFIRGAGTLYMYIMYVYNFVLRTYNKIYTHITACMSHGCSSSITCVYHTCCTRVLVKLPLGGTVHVYTCSIQCTLYIQKIIYREKRNNCPNAPQVTHPHKYNVHICMYIVSVYVHVNVYIPHVHLN